jgi:DNA-binding MarR family transcriptional regulator
MADLTFSLLEHCELKRERMAETLALTVAEFKLILAMHDEDGVTAGDLARRIELSNSRLTRILDGLAAKKLVSRDVSAEDRRVMRIRLTPAGVKVREELRKSYVQTHRDILDLLPKGADRSVIFAMEKLLEAMKTWEKI